MSLQLPRPLEAYVKATNENDPEAFVRCFAEDAIVHDEDRARKGRQAIKTWFLGSKEKYQHRIEPLSAQPMGERWLLNMSVAGNFDGSPIELEYEIAIRDGLIQELGIR